ncbi:hypothetical protein DYB28_003000 [Aphanomyces astaci]|uniref:Uncharacterized protein n=1 Tax=Aphanomyces astaci TaxID=112090 RepID=A0A9X8HFX1_APHAT|nr:hypothetical protein DYB28_003000 [Aphanomyces astaci]
MIPQRHTSTTVADARSLLVRPEMLIILRGGLSSAPSSSAAAWPSAGVLLAALTLLESSTILHPLCTL